jgi:hypothetical protein
LATPTRRVWCQHLLEQKSTQTKVRIRLGTRLAGGLGFDGFGGFGLFFGIVLVIDRITSLHVIIDLLAPIADGYLA